MRSPSGSKREREVRLSYSDEHCINVKMLPKTSTINEKTKDRLNRERSDEQNVSPNKSHR